MSWRNEIVVWCDDCGEERVASCIEKVSEAREAAERRGWDTGRGQDLCPDCKDNG